MEHLVLQVGAVQELEVRVVGLHDVHLLTLDEHHLHPVWMHGPQGDRLPLLVVDDGEGVALAHQPGDDGEPEREDVHP